MSTIVVTRNFSNSTCNTLAQVVFPHYLFIIIFIYLSIHVSFSMCISLPIFSPLFFNEYFTFFLIPFSFYYFSFPFIPFLLLAFPLSLSFLPIPLTLSSISFLSFFSSLFTACISFHSCFYYQYFPLTSFLYSFHFH